jgi:molecular chaperone DnaK (HSP70)
MKLGVDFGTTRIVVAAADRGNYPVVSFDTAEGCMAEWVPPLIAVRGAQRLYGWAAWNAQEQPGWTCIRSIKRLLENAGPATEVELGGGNASIVTLLREMCEALRAALLTSSNLRLPADEKLEIMLGVPANANTNQRFLTVEAFRQAGFEVLGLLNEPSAASIEYGHREKKSIANARVLVYDLGGGTFDASVVEIDGATHSVIASEGISTLGGDDFDGILAELALDAAGLDQDELTQSEMFRLHEECREKKEALHPNTRKLSIDLERVRLGWPAVTLPVLDFYDRCRELIEATVGAVDELLNRAGDRPIETLYVTGGGSELPAVGRLLRERFGRRVRRSAYTRSATAIGLAIQADASSGYVLRDRFTRWFGVWREADEGRRVVFDPLYEKGTPLPLSGEPPLEKVRRYHPAHNAGHFRYLECSHVTPAGEPAGDIAVWDQIRFAFDPSLAAESDLTEVPVERMISAATDEIEERYLAGTTGAIAVTISNLTAGYSREFRLARWSEAPATAAPARKRTSAGR